MAFGWKYLGGSWRNWNTLAPHKYQNGCELPELNSYSWMMNFWEPCLIAKGIPKASNLPIFWFKYLKVVN